MSKFLRHFTVVGDDYHTWNINYKKWENEEEDEEEEPPAVPASGEEGGAGDAEAAPRSAPKPTRDFRSILRKLFSSHRFQVGGAKAQRPQAGKGLLWKSPGLQGGTHLCHSTAPSQMPTMCQEPRAHWGAMGPSHVVREEIILIISR